MATLSKLVVQISGNTKKLTSALSKAEGRLKKFKAVGSKALKAVGKVAKGLAIGGGIAIAGFAVAAVKNFLDVGEQLDKMSKRTGFTVESLGELKFAAEQAGAWYGDHRERRLSGWRRPSWMPARALGTSARRTALGRPGHIGRDSTGSLAGGAVSEIR